LVSLLQRFANGKSTGVVLDCGASSCSAVPVFDGHVLKKGLCFVNKQKQLFLHFKKKQQ